MKPALEWHVVACREPGCRWVEAFQTAQAAVDAGQYHCRREKHLGFTPRTLGNLLQAYEDGLAAVVKAGGDPKEAA